MRFLCPLRFLSEWQRKYTKKLILARKQMEILKNFNQCLQILVVMKTKYLWIAQHWLSSLGQGGFLTWIRLPSG